MPNDITQEIVIKWRCKVLERATSTTFNTYARHLRSLFNFAIEQGWLVFDKNPFTKVFLREGKKKRKVLSDKQIDTVIALFSNTATLPKILQPKWFMLAMIQTFRYTGIRRSQLVKLQIRDIDLQRQIIIIPSHINKNHNYHEIPIAQKLLPYLKKLLMELQKLERREDDQAFNVNLFSSAVFDKNAKMSNEQVTHIFAVISDLVDFKVSPHRFRHTIATNLMRNPENLYNVQKLLNHSDVSVTLSYIDYDAEMIRRCVDDL